MGRWLLGLCLMAAPGHGADLAAGWHHSLALDGDGRLWAWGDNAQGQLGLPAVTRSPVPLPGEATGLTAVAAGGFHSLAIAPDGAVLAWGANRFGQLGNGRSGWGEQQTQPAPVETETGGLTGVVAIAAGWDHSLALRGDGTVWAWGSRDQGQVGDGRVDSDAPATRPVRVLGLTDIVAIAAGGHHSLALRRDGRLFAWGGNGDAQLGNGQRGAAVATPAPVLDAAGQPLANVTAIAAGALHSVAVAEGQTLAWGYDGTGQLAQGDRGGFWESAGSRLNRPTPLPVQYQAETPPAAAELAAGFESTYLRTADGALLSAGWSVYGELGIGSLGGSRDRLGPASRAMMLVWDDPTAGLWQPELVYRYTDHGHIADGVDALEIVDRFDGPALRIGAEEAGETALAAVDRNEKFVEVVALVEYPTAAPAGRPVRFQLDRLQFGMHVGDDDFAEEVRLRLTETGSGRTVELPIRLGEADRRVQYLPAFTDLRSVVAGMHHALGRDADGRLWAWGHNGYGQLGDGTFHDAATPRPALAFDPAATEPPPIARVAPALPDWFQPYLKLTAPAAPADAVPLPNAAQLGDGVRLAQAAIQQAIDETSANGGGTILFPTGVYRTGTLSLKDGVHLYLADGAVILGSTNRAHYPQSALIWAENAADIGISGEGVVDAQGQYTGARGWRPQTVRMVGCRKVTLDSLSTINSGSWTQHYIDCHELTIRNCLVRGPRPGRNNDGIDLVGCQDTLVTGCTVVSDDDAIVIKTQRSDLVNRNIRVIGNRCLTYRGAYKLGTESRGRYENLKVRDLLGHGAKALELYSVDGSETSGIDIERVRVDSALSPLSLRLGARLRESYFQKGENRVPGYLRDVRIADVEVELARRSYREVLLQHGIVDGEEANPEKESPHSAFISGLPGHWIENVRIENFRIWHPGGQMDVPDPAEEAERPEAYPGGAMFGTLPAFGMFVRHARNVTVKDLTVYLAAPDARPATAEVDTEAVVFDNLTVKGPR